MMFDWTISVGNILTIVSLVSTVLYMFFTMRTDIKVMRHDISSLEKGQTILNEAFVQLGKILTQVAVQDNRLFMLEKNMDEIKHGQGFVTSK